MLALPGKGSADIVSVNEFGPEAMFRFENYLTPSTLYFDAGDDPPKAIKSLPARFDASGLVTEQFEATSRTAPKFPISSRGRKTFTAPRPRCFMAMAASRCR